MESDLRDELARVLLADKVRLRLTFTAVNWMLVGMYAVGAGVMADKDEWWSVAVFVVLALWWVWQGVRDIREARAALLTLADRARAAGGKEATLAELGITEESLKVPDGWVRVKPQAQEPNP